MGPMGVGKSLISRKMNEKLKNHAYISIDNLWDLAIAFHERGPEDFDSYKSMRLSDFYRFYLQQKCVDQNSPDAKELLKIFNKEFDVETSEMRFYFRNFKFDRFYNCVDAYMQIENSSLTLAAKSAAKQYYRLKFLEKVMNQIDFPAIFDLGGDIGAVIDLNIFDMNNFDQVMQGKDVSCYQESLLNQFGKRVYLAPGLGYENELDPRINDATNKLYKKSPESYERYANIKLCPNGLFNNSKRPMFGHLSCDDARALKSQLDTMNLSQIDNVTTQIISMGKELDATRTREGK